MRKCLLLTKILLKCGMGNVLPRNNNAKNTRLRRVGSVLLKIFLLLCLLPLMWVLYEMASAVYDILPPNLKYFSCDLVCLALSFASLLFSLPYLLSMMFFAKDVEFLLPMPFRSWQVAGAKLLNVLAYEYITVALLGIPLFLGIGVSAHSGAGFWISALLTLLAVPVLPIVYGSVLGLLFISLTRRMRHREALTTLFSILIMIGGMCIGMFSSYIGEEITSDAVLQILMGSRRLVMGAFYLFPNLFLAQKALTAGSVLMALAYLASAIVLIFVFLIVGNRFYLKSVVGISETVQTKRLLSRTQEAHALRSTNVVWAFAAKEWKILVRTPIYFMNCIVSAFILPFVFLAMLFLAHLQSSADKDPTLLQIFSHLARLSTETKAGLLLLIVFCFATFLGNMNLIASTCISREGGGYIYMKYIPVPYKKQLQGKVLLALLVSFAATVPYTVLLSVFCTVTLKTPVWLPALALAVNVLTVMALVYLQLICDLWMPKLEWTSEHVPVKQNFVTMFPMLGSMLPCIALCALAIVLVLHGAAARFIIAAGIALLAALAFGLRASAYRYGERALHKL